MQNILSIILLSCIGLLIVAVYGRFVETRWLRLKTISIRNPELHRVLGGRKIVHLSDLHLDAPWHPAARKAVECVREIRPDLICITGDFIKWFGGEKAFESATAYVDQFKAPLGTYAVLGDADYSALGNVSRLIRHSENSSDFHLLRNEWRPIDTGSGQLIIAGFDHASDIPAKPFVESLPAGIPVLLLAHVSAVFNELEARNPVTVLAGDSHGGQIHFPAFLWRRTGRKPDPKHIYGLFSEGMKSLYVTSGIGTSRPHIRIGRRPEVVVIEFVA